MVQYSTPLIVIFNTYYMLVGDVDGVWFETIGYQLKEGKEIPTGVARNGFQSFVVRGKAALK